MYVPKEEVRETRYKFVPFPNIWKKVSHLSVIYCYRNLGTPAVGHVKSCAVQGKDDISYNQEQSTFNSVKHGYQLKLKEMD